MRLAIQAAPVGNFQLLKFTSAGIGGVTEYEETFVGITRKSVDAIASQVGAERDRVCLQVVEAGGGVGGGGAADVATLGVEDYRNIRRDCRQRGAQRCHARRAQRLVEGDVGFVGADQVGGLRNDSAVPGQDGGGGVIGVLTIAGGNLVGRRVETDAEQRLVALDGSREFGEEIRHSAPPASIRHKV